jgi:hypothetical protein
MPVWLTNFIGGPIIQKLLDFIPDPALRAQQAFELQKAAEEECAKANADQREINKTEAASANWFVAGARPACMWLCVTGLAWQFFVAPMLTWLLTVVFLVVGVITGHHYVIPALPLLGDATLTDLLYALLGLGTMRSLDKKMGVDTKEVGGILQGVTSIFKR